jgi:hypothetical protein
MIAFMSTITAMAHLAWKRSFHLVVSVASTTNATAAITITVAILHFMRIIAVKYPDSTVITDVIIILNTRNPCICHLMFGLIVFAVFLLRLSLFIIMVLVANQGFSTQTVTSR